MKPTAAPISPVRWSVTSKDLRRVADAAFAIVLLICGSFSTARSHLAEPGPPPVYWPGTQLSEFLASSGYSACKEIAAPNTTGWLTELKFDSEDNLWMAQDYNPYIGLLEAFASDRYKRFKGFKVGRLSGFTFDREGNIWANHSVGGYGVGGTMKLLELSKSSSYMTQSDVPVLSTLLPLAIAADYSDNLWIAGFPFQTGPLNSEVIKLAKKDGYTNPEEFSQGTIARELAISRSGDLFATVDPKFTVDPKGSVIELKQEGSQLLNVRTLATGNITMDRRDNLWVAEPIGPLYYPAGPNKVIELTSASRFLERKSFAVPRRVFGVAVDRSNNIWVTSPFKNLPYVVEGPQRNFRPEDITRLEAASNYSAQKTSIVPGWPFGVASDSAGNVWTANGRKSDSDNVIELLASSGHTTQKFFSVPGTPYGVAVDKHDNVWLTGRFQGYGVVELAHDANYKVSRTLKIPEPGMGIAFDRANNLWVADFQLHDSNVMQFLARSGYRDHRSYTLEGSPFALAFDSLDNLWAAAAGCPRDRVVELLRAASYRKEVSYPVDGRPYGVAVDAKNNVWAAVADEPRLELTEFSRSAGYSLTRRFEVPGNPAIGIDSQENIWLQSFESVEDNTLTGVGRYGLGGYEGYR
jgi:DNA-binding beta-propeller fold protein YncE